MKWITSDYLSLIAIIVSVLALLMPLWQFLYIRVFKPLSLRIIPFGRTNFIFNESGSYAVVKFSIECKNRNIVINNVRVDISTRRTTKEETLYLDWNFIDPVSLSWIGSNMANSINTTSYAHPIKVGKDTIEPCIVEFANNSIEATNALTDIANQRNEQLNSFILSLSSEGQKPSVQAVIDGFRKTNEYRVLCSSYEKYLFWESGEYTLTVFLDYDNGKIHSQSFTFSVSVEEAKQEKENIDKTVFCKMMKENSIPVNFYLIQKCLKMMDVKKVKP